MAWIREIDEQDARGELAEVYEVSTRTVERDILALQEAGVPIIGMAGRRGGKSAISTAVRSKIPLPIFPAAPRIVTFESLSS